MKRLVALMICAVSLGAAAQSGDCSSYMTLSSTPSGCDASGSVTANVTECSTSISGAVGLGVLYEAFQTPDAEACLTSGGWPCVIMGEELASILYANMVSYPDLMNTLMTLAPLSPIMGVLYEAFQTPDAEDCVLTYNGAFGGSTSCTVIGEELASILYANTVSYDDLMMDIAMAIFFQGLAGSGAYNDCIVSWSDSTGNSLSNTLGEGFTASGLPAGTYTASLTHSNGCTDTQTIEVLLECGGCMDALACNYSSQAIVDDSSCIYNDDCGVCGGDNSSCSGCTHENATNYDSTATIEDGSCLYSQETHDAGYNAGYEAGAASVECPPCANSDCPGDFTADGYIGVDDILSMLSLYDTSCSE